MGWLHQGGIELDRKVLADIAVHDPEGFTRIVEQAKGFSNAEPPAP